MIGQTIGSYAILAKIGEGGMGEVYRARDVKLGRDVALKLLPASLAAEPDRLLRFRREAQMLASLNHPHIAAIYGFEDAGASHALVMELVEGPTLAERIALGPIPLEDVRPIATQIAVALEAAHEQAIVHRDLKPANVKIRPDGTVKVLDFGLAKAMEPAAAAAGGNVSMSPTLSIHATQAGFILGTAAYMSPEQARGRSVDRRADVWAFGCVCYEMLTGRRAFEGEDISDTLAAVLRTEPDWSALPPSLPPPITAMLKAALEKDPQKRLPHMSTARFLLDAPALRVDPPPAPASARPRARRWLWLASAAALLIAVTAALTLALSAPAPAPEPLVARLPLPLPANELFTGTALPVVGVSRDGSQIAYLASNRLYVRGLSDPSPRRLLERPETAIGTSIYHPVFSPDGESIAFMIGSFPQGATITSMPVGGGIATSLATVKMPLGMSWDDSGIVFADTNGIYRIPPTGGKPEQLIATRQGELAEFPSMLPGGDAVVFALAKIATDNTGLTLEDWRRASIVAQSLRTGQRVTLVTGAAAPHYLPTGHLAFMIEGVLYAQPFDATTLTVSGKRVPIVEGVLRQSGGAAAAHVAVSDAGVLAYVPGPVSLNGQTQSLLRITREGSSERLPLPVGQYIGPRVSRDGKRLTVGIDDGKDANVWVYDLSGATAIRQLTFGGQNRYPLWSPDDQRIAFASTREAQQGIFWQRADGASGPERLTKADEGSLHVPETFSPDGRYLLFVGVKGDVNTLYILDVRDRTTSRFSDVQSLAATAAAFSPDGRWVAYTRRDEPTGSIALFVEPFPPTGAKFRIAATGFRPLWSRTGDELFFGTRGQSWVASVTTTPQFAFANPKELPIRRYPPLYIGEREYDLLPDGRFVFAMPADSESVIPREIQVVINWFQELNRRVPRAAR